MITRTTLIGLLAMLTLSLHAQIGTWRAYLSYQNPTIVERGEDNEVYVVGSGGLFIYNEDDQSIRTLDKISGLHDQNVLFIAWNKAVHRLVIVYENGNIDLMDKEGNVYGVPDYYQQPLQGSKAVKGLSVYGTKAYISTDQGIVIVNVEGAHLETLVQLDFTIYYTWEEGNYLYASGPAKGIFRIPKSSNVMDKSLWTKVGEFQIRPQTMDNALLEKVKKLNAGGPLYNHFAHMRYTNGRLYTVPGGYYSYKDDQRLGAVQILEPNKEWTILRGGDDYFFRDFDALAIDPKDPNHIWVGARGGVFEYEAGQLKKHYGVNNSILTSPTNEYYAIVQSLAYDKKGQLWLLNSYNKSFNLIRVSSTGEWTPVPIADMKGKQSLTHIYEDSRGLLWMVNDHWDPTLVFAHNPETGQTKTIRQFINQDNTTIATALGIHCLNEDEDGNIWLGTSQGPLQLTPQQLNEEFPQWTQPKVPRNDGSNLADYLLTGVETKAIIFDRANRMWVGTAGSGVYCFDVDRTTEVFHFTTTNSHLLSNNIESLAFNHDNGELFIGTDQGLCSYITDERNAVEGMTQSNVWAYPNPVPPDYMGAITITGLSAGADVKIVSTNGTLVEQGKASNGQYKWYGLDAHSQRVASGVYMVEVATATGEKGVVCRIAVVR